MLDRAAMRRAARSRLEAVGVEIDVDQPVAELPVGRRQIVAIVKALTYASRILVMDEPTAALTAAKVERLFAVMRDRCARRRYRYISTASRRSRASPIGSRCCATAGWPMAPPARRNRNSLPLVGRPLNELYPRRSGSFGARLISRARATGRSARAGWQAPNGFR